VIRINTRVVHLVRASPFGIDLTGPHSGILSAPGYEPLMRLRLKKNDGPLVLPSLRCLHWNRRCHCLSMTMSLLPPLSCFILGFFFPNDWYTTPRRRLLKTLPSTPSSNDRYCLLRQPALLNSDRSLQHSRNSKRL